MNRNGALLIEVMVALALLSTTGTAAMVLLRQSMSSMENASQSIMQRRAEHQFLGVVTLWSREELDRRLGTRPQHPWLLRVLRSGEDVYQITLLDSLEQRPILRTAVYRPVNDATNR